MGAGSWGTALAAVLARNEHRVVLWGRDAEQIQSLRRTQINERYLPGLKLPTNLTYQSSFKLGLKDAQAIVIATPCASFREILEKLTLVGHQQTAMIWACKGLEPGTSKLLHTVATEVLGEEATFGIISGPTFAKEVTQDLPAAVTIATQPNDFAHTAASWFHGNHFRAYTSDDLIGVQIGGALKNVLAIAAGIADGLQLGANSRAALITRGLAELMRLGENMGGQKETFMGLAGIGDLVLTCTDNLSRNRRMGLALAEGLSVEQAQARIGQAVEGVKTAAEAWQLAQKHGVSMPITEQVHAVITGQTSPKVAVSNLLNRDLKPEQL